MFKLENYITADTVDFISKLTHKAATDPSNALGFHSRLFDHVIPLPSSALVFEYASFACQAESNREQWLQRCLAEGILNIFDESGELKAAVRNQLQRLSGLSADKLDEWLYQGLSKNAVHMQWLSAYVLSICDRAYRVLPEGFMTCPNDVDPDEFLPATTSQWIMATLPDYCACPERFSPMVRQAFMDHKTQQDTEVIEYWYRAQQCAQRVEKGTSAQVAYTQAVMQLQSTLLLNLSERIGDNVSADALADEYNRIAKLAGAIAVSEEQATVISRLWYTLNSFNHINDENFIEKLRQPRQALHQFYHAANLDLSSQLGCFEKASTDFSFFGLKRSSNEAGDDRRLVINVSENNALMGPVSQVLKQHVQSQNFSTWSINKQPVTGRWLYQLWRLILPQTHSFRLQMATHDLAEMKRARGETEKDFQLRRLKVMQDLVYLSERWLSRHENLDTWQKLCGTQERLISIMTLRQQLDARILQTMKIIDQIQDQERIQHAEAGSKAMADDSRRGVEIEMREYSSSDTYTRSTAAARLPSENHAGTRSYHRLRLNNTNRDQNDGVKHSTPNAPAKSSSVNQVTNFGLIFFGCFLLSYLARYMPHPHVGHLTSMMMRLGFSSLPAVAYSSGILSQLSLWRNQVGHSSQAVSHDQAADETVTPQASGRPEV